MPKRIPIEAAKKVAKEQGCRQVILLAWDGVLTHVVTYGESIEDCAQAAAGGNILKTKWGWPECNDQPSRVKARYTQGKLDGLKEALALARDNAISFPVNAQSIVAAIEEQIERELEHDKELAHA